MNSRRLFMKEVALSAGGLAVGLSAGAGGRVFAAEAIPAPLTGEGLPAYLLRQYGEVEATRYAQVLGAANPFKEGDEIIGVAAADEQSRVYARQLLSNTRLEEIDRFAPHQDELYDYIQSERTAQSTDSPDTLGDLRGFLLAATEQEIQHLMPALSSDVIGSVVKLMDNAELTAVGAKVFNALPGSNIGARGYLGARVQPNSPTDNPDDIRWQVFNAFSYAVGDVLLGTNPVSSTVESVSAIQFCLQDVLQTFGLTDVLPHCVLSHIDVQAEVERLHPDSTALWFQSIAGNVSANGTFDVTLEKMKAHAAARTGSYGLYFETGQGADFTNGHGHGFDMVLHESRKYGFARALSKIVAANSALEGEQAWVHLNDVAGFIGPEVFRSKEQLVRCCLEDIVMGKLHGLCLGLDVCSTLHMDVSLEDLDWCLNEIAPANPAYLMALPTKIDPMLGYLTTGYQDHVRLRERFGYKINDPMWEFFKRLGIIDAQGRPTDHFGDPNWVYLQYQRLKDDSRSDAEVLLEGRQQIESVRDRGLFIAEGHGDLFYQLDSDLEQEVNRIYEDGKLSIWAELQPDFIASVPALYPISTQSRDRVDYILHPDSGERLSLASQRQLEALKQAREQGGQDIDVQIVISDGLNAHSIMDEGHLLPFLETLREELVSTGFTPADENMLITSGRVRTGYRIGESLFADANKPSTILHVIGERPGTGHHTFSVYITRAESSSWAEPDVVDHNITRVVSGIANTALLPREGAIAVSRMLAGRV